MCKKCGRPIGVFGRFWRWFFGCPTDLRGIPYDERCDRKEPFYREIDDEDFADLTSGVRPGLAPADEEWVARINRNRRERINKND
jgi:hypothetical protein